MPLSKYVYEVCTDTYLTLKVFTMGVFGGSMD